MPSMKEYANCAECGQGRETRFLDPDGVCARCTMTVIRLPEAPLPSQAPAFWKR